MRIKNWKRFQHFKDRRPPWIKLYRDLLDDMEWHELDPLAGKHLIMIWLIASEDGGVVPCNKELAFRLRCTEKQIESTISKIGHWLEQGDISLISPGYQETRKETETETYKQETETPLSGKPDQGGNGFSPDDMAKIWNSTIEAHTSGFDGEKELPRVLKLTPDRRKQCHTRIKSLGLTKEKWEDVMVGIFRSKFLVGVNDRGWVANFDWITRNDKNVLRVVEGW